MGWGEGCRWLIENFFLQSQLGILRVVSSPVGVKFLGAGINEGCEHGKWTFLVQRGSVRVWRGSARVGHGSVRVGRGSVRVRRGSVRVRHGSVGRSSPAARRPRV